MTVSVMIISHDEIGSSLLNAATKTLGELPLPTTVVTVNYDTDPDDLLPRLERASQNIERGEGLLILTDLFGSTPCNIARRLENHNTKVISGLNLSMLLKIMNYPDLTVDELAAKAVSGGREGILICGECETNSC